MIYKIVRIKFDLKKIPEESKSRKILLGKNNNLRHNICPFEPNNSFLKHLSLKSHRIIESNEDIAL